MPESLWNTVPPEAQVAILAVIAALEKRIAELEHKLNLSATPELSSRPSNYARASRSSRRTAKAVAPCSREMTPIRYDTKSPRSRPFVPTSMNTVSTG
jgi:hypothetical protein